MPSLLHELILELFHARPLLAAELLEAAAVLQPGEIDRGSLVEAPLSEVVPVEYRADGVIELTGRRRLAVVAEAQLRPDPDKLWSWPYYLCAVRARLRCPCVLLVVTPQARTERWAARAIDIGPEASIRPIVLGPSRIPQVTDPARARDSPELAVLSTLAHGHGPAGEAIGLAALQAASGLDEDRFKLYTDLVLQAVHAVARRALEGLMLSKWEPRSEFWKKVEAERALALVRTRELALAEGREEGLEEGREVGREEGREDGMRGLLLTLLERRFGPLPASIVARVQAADRFTLDHWAKELLSAQSLEALFGGA